MNLPGINQKKNPVGRQSTKKNDNDNNSNSNFLVSTAEIVVEVYRLKNTAGNENKSIRQVIDLLRNRLFAFIFFGVFFRGKKSSKLFS
jgi:predicted nucleic-acid-binding protein